MPPVGFEPNILAGERPQTYALDRSATGTGIRPYKQHIFLKNDCVLKRTIFLCSADHAS